MVHGSPEMHFQKQGFVPRELGFDTDRDIGIMGIVYEIQNLRKINWKLSGGAVS